MSWEKTTIGKHCEITSSKRIFFSDYTDHGIPFFRSKEIIEMVQHKDISESLFISQEKYDEIACKFGVPSAGDLLLTSVGTIGIPYIIKESDHFYFKDGNLTWFRNFDTGLLSAFLYYWFLSDEGMGVLNNSTIGSSQKALTISNIKKIQIPLFPLNIQSKIVSILSAYDSLIENNQKQIKLLEEAAQRLYKEWFVDLRFPGWENTKIVDGVPEGWEKLPLSSFADIVMGQSPKSEFYNTTHDGIPFHQGVGSYGKRFVVDNIFSNSYARIAEAGSILFSVRAPVGRLNITKNKIAIGRGLAALNHKKGYQCFLFYLLKDRFFKDDLLGNGSIFASISKNELYNQVFIVPSNFLANQYNIIVSNIDRKISVIDEQLNRLVKTRDGLLSKLMNAETEV